MKPPFAYYGGKTRIAARLVQLLPEHTHYVEPFAGSLAVLFAKPRSKMETVNDLDGDLITFWRVLRDRGDELAAACAFTPHARAEYEAAYDLDATDEVERARRVWVRLTQSRTGTLRQTGWRYYEDPGGSSVGMPRYLAGYVDRIPPAARRLHGVTLESRPAIDMVRAYGRHAGVCLYCDPPYVGSTRWPGYRVEMGSDDAHGELLDELARCTAAVVLSGYATDLYDDALTGWDRVELATSTNQGTGPTERTEVVWSNRPITTPSLFDATLTTTKGTPR